MSQVRLREPEAAQTSGGEHAGHALEVAGLWRELGDRAVLRDVSLELRHGETLAVLGPNGAGKTTLLRILATLLRPSAGDVSVLGCALPRQAGKARGRIGSRGHEPLLYRDLSCAENLRFQARLHGLQDEGVGRVAELLDRVGLARWAGERVGTLSAGMVQRLAVCRAVLHEPELLLLDEPRSHLDPAAAELVEPLIGRAAGRPRGVAPHAPAGGLAEADLVLGLRAGRTAFMAPPADVDAARI